MEKLQGVESISEKIQVLSDYGIVLTEEEFESACDQAYDILEENAYIANGELTQKSLDLISGGVNVGVSSVGVGVGSY